MGHQDRYPVFPTQMEKSKLKNKIEFLEKAEHNLDSLVKQVESECRECVEQMQKKQSELNDKLKETGMLAAEARFIFGDLNSAVLNTTMEPRLKIVTTKEKIAGLQMDRFKAEYSGRDPFALLGLAKGGMKVNALKEAYKDAIETILELTSLRTKFDALEEKLKLTKRKKNALEIMVIPKTKRTIKYIEEEIDESERDNFFRMKLVKKLQEASHQKHEDEQQKSQGTDGEKKQDRGIKQQNNAEKSQDTDDEQKQVVEIGEKDNAEKSQDTDDEQKQEIGIEERGNAEKSHDTDGELKQGIGIGEKDNAKKSPYTDDEQKQGIVIEKQGNSEKSQDTDKEQKLGIGIEGKSQAENSQASDFDQKQGIGIEEQGKAEGSAENSQDIDKEQKQGIITENQGNTEKSPDTKEEQKRGNAEGNAEKSQDIDDEQQTGVGIEDQGNAEKFPDTDKEQKQGIGMEVQGNDEEQMEGIEIEKTGSSEQKKDDENNNLPPSPSKIIKKGKVEYIL